MIPLHQCSYSVFGRTCNTICADERLLSKHFATHFILNAGYNVFNNFISLNLQPHQNHLQPPIHYVSSNESTLSPEEPPTTIATNTFLYCYQTGLIESVPVNLSFRFLVGIPSNRFFILKHYLDSLGVPIPEIHTKRIEKIHHRDGDEGLVGIPLQNDFVNWICHSPNSKFTTKTYIDFRKAALSREIEGQRENIYNCYHSVLTTTFKDLNDRADSGSRSLFPLTFFNPMVYILHNLTTTMINLTKTKFTNEDDIAIEYLDPESAEYVEYSDCGRAALGVRIRHELQEYTRVLVRMRLELYKILLDVTADILNRLVAVFFWQNSGEVEKFESLCCSGFSCLKKIDFSVPHHRVSFRAMTVSQDEFCSFKVGKMKNNIF